LYSNAEKQLLRSFRPMSIVAKRSPISATAELLFKQLLLRKYAVDFVEICNVCVGKMIIKAAKRIFNSDKVCRSYSDLNFGVTFLEHSLEIYFLWNVVGLSAP